jgi:hypothetical protein
MCLFRCTLYGLTTIIFTMNKTFLLCSLLFILLCSFGAQAQGAHDATVRYSSMDRPGFVAEYPLSRELIENALKERLEKAGVKKAKSQKGFAYYKEVNWPEVSPALVDVYTNVEGKGDRSTVQILVSKGYDNYISSATDAVLGANVIKFLNDFITDALAYQLRLMIAGQEENIRKAEKAYKNADEDGNKLAREKDKIERQIADNNRDKSKLADALKSEQQKLTELQKQVK